MKFKLLLFLVVIFLSVHLVRSSNMSVGETIVHQPSQVNLSDGHLFITRVNPSEAYSGQEVEIKLIVNSTFNKPLQLTATEVLISDAVYLDKNITLSTINYDVIPVHYYIWHFSLEPHSSKTLTYHIKFNGLGTFSFSPATVSDQFGDKADSPATYITIKCQPNGQCEEDENYLFCPEDCNTGEKDKICDAAIDGKCDPDCEEGYDLDCNKLNDTQKQSCNMLRDGYCNQSCLNEDPDCVSQAKTQTNFLIIGIVIVVIIALLFIAFYYKRKNNT